MQTDYLRYFIDVAALGSMNAAAKKNFMTPQGISRSITALESELGCKLFYRDSNKVTLTHYGEVLLENARELIEHENSMRRSVLSLQTASLRKRAMRFTFYCSPFFFNTKFLYPAAGLGTALYGNVQLLQRATPRVSDLLVSAARNKQPDVIVAGGLGLYDLFPEKSADIIRSLAEAGYEYRPFMRTRDLVLVPSFSPLADVEKLSNATIAMHPIAVTANEGLERAISQHVGTQGIYIASDDEGYRNHLCRMGEALTFVPGFSLAFGVPEGTVAIPMQEPYTIEVAFAARADAFQKGMLADIISRLSDFYSQHRNLDTFELLDGSLESSLFA